MTSQMLICRQDFIDRVNRWADAHHAPGLTDRMLEDWNEECVFPAGISILGSNSEVPIRFYNWRHYLHALLICRLKKNGQKRFAQIRIALWFRGLDIAGGVPKDDLAAEYERAIKKLLVPINSTYVPTFDKDENDNRFRRLRKQLGEQSPVFRNTILEARDNWLMAGYLEGRYGEPQKGLRDFENAVLGRVAAEWGMNGGTIPEVSWPAGLMANPDETVNPGISLLLNSRDEELNAAREIYLAFLALPQLMGFMEAAGLGGNLELTRQFCSPIPHLKYSVRQTPAWRLFLLVYFLTFQKQDPERAKLIRTVNYRVISMHWAEKSGTKLQK